MSNRETASNMKIKDIPDILILKFLRDLPYSEILPEEKMYAHWYDFKPWPINTVMRALPKGAHSGQALAKMRSLGKRGLVDGCFCGCSGDFSITEAGLAFLKETDGEKNPENYAIIAEALFKAENAKEHEQYEVGAFYWVIPANDPDAKEQWEREIQPARYAGNCQWNTLGGDGFPDDWSMKWVGDKIIYKG